MKFDVDEARLPLAPGRLVHLELAPRTRLRGLAGQTWVTLDDDRRDIVLVPGDEFVTTAGGHALAMALRAGGTAELWVAACYARCAAASSCFV